MTTLSVQNVSKTFSSSNVLGLFGRSNRKQIKALDDVSLTIPPGSITALVGPNGAGKTTLINTICGLIYPDSGNVSVCGHLSPAENQEARNKIGLVTTNDRSFFWRLTGRQNLNFFGALYRLSRQETESRVDQLIAAFGLSHAADRRFHTYSTGMKKRLGLARALLHRPEILLFDEPTVNLDVIAVRDLLQLVSKEIIGSGRCILWATHLFDEVLRICDRVAVLVAGRICFEQSVKEFVNLCISNAGLQIDFSFPEHQRAAVLDFVATVPEGSEVFSSSATISLPRTRNSHLLASTITRLVDLEATIYGIQPHANSLSMMFEYFNRH
jgi:ABC-2 type transport system ATP-binding protein